MLISLGAPSAMYSWTIFWKNKNCSWLSSPLLPLLLCRPSAFRAGLTPPLPPGPSLLPSAAPAPTSSKNLA